MKLLKSWLLYIAYLLSRVILFPISFVLYPFLYPLRFKAIEYAEMDNSKWYHPLFIIHMFFTREVGDKHLHYVGNYWFKSKLKDKYFTEYYDDEKFDPIVTTFKQRVVYFYISFCWNVFRNYAWGFDRLFKEGGYMLFDNGYWTFSLMNLTPPQLKFTDEYRSFSGDSGEYLLFRKLDGGYSESNCVKQGFLLTKIITSKNNFRPCLYFAKVVPLFNRYLAIEIRLGWSIDLGWTQFRFKVLIKK